MNIYSNTQFTIQPPSEEPPAKKRKLELFCCIDQLPPELLDKTFNYLIISEIPNLTLVNRLWKNVSIEHAIHRTIRRIQTLVKSLSSSLGPEEHESEKADLKKIAKCSDMFACSSLNMVNKHFSVTKQQLATVMSTLSEDHLDALGPPRPRDFITIILEALSKKAESQLNTKDRTRSFSKLAQNLIQNGFMDRGKRIAAPLLDKAGFDILGLVEAYADKSLVSEVLHVLNVAKLVTVDDIGQASLVFVLEKNFEALDQFFAQIPQEYTDAAYYGAALGFAMNGAIPEAKDYIDRISESRDYFVEKTLKNLDDFPEQLEELQNLLGI